MFKLLLLVHKCLGSKIRVILKNIQISDQNNQDLDTLMKQQVKEVNYYLLNLIMKYQVRSVFILFDYV